MLSRKTKSSLIYNFREKYLGLNLSIINVEDGTLFPCCLVTSLLYSCYGYFLALVCIYFPRFYKRGLKQVFKFLQTHAKNGPWKTDACMNYFYKKFCRANLSGKTLFNIILLLTCFLTLHAVFF